MCLLRGNGHVASIPEGILRAVEQARERYNYVEIEGNIIVFNLFTAIEKRLIQSRPGRGRLKRYYRPFCLQYW